MDETVLLYVGLPRIIAASLGGASLSLAGLALQNVFRNYLASPGILGVTSSSAFGAALAVLLFPITLVTVQLTSFFSGLVATVLSYRLARMVRGGIISLVLAEIVVSALFSALLGFRGEKVDGYTVCTARHAYQLSILLLMRWGLNILSLGDEEALSLGLSVERYKAVCVLAATLATSSSTSLAGMIAWNGIVAPHISRLLAGFDNRRLSPCRVSWALFYS